MRLVQGLLPLLAATLINAPVIAQDPVTGSSTPPAELAKSADKKLEANKMLALNIRREVLEARHIELIDKYYAPGLIQHNPTFGNGLEAMKQAIGRGGPPKDIKPTFERPITALIAEGDMVVIVSPRELPDPKDPSKKYTTTAFDMYRIKDGKVVEHWDAAVKSAN